MSEDTEVSAEGPGGFKFRARGYDAVVGVMILALGIFGYGLYIHMTESKAVMETVAKSINDGVKVQRLTACIVATKEDLREVQYSNPQSFCNRMSQ